MVPLAFTGYFLDLPSNAVSIEFNVFESAASISYTINVPDAVSTSYANNLFYSYSHTSFDLFPVVFHVHEIKTD